MMMLDRQAELRDLGRAKRRRLLWLVRAPLALYSSGRWLTGLTCPTKPNLSPIHVLAARTSTERYVGAAAKRAFDEYRVAQLPHLTRSIHYDLLNPLLDLSSLTAR